MFISRAAAASTYSGQQHVSGIHVQSASLMMMMILNSIFSIVLRLYRCYPGHYVRVTNQTPTVISKTPVRRHLNVTGGLRQQMKLRT